MVRVVASDQHDPGCDQRGGKGGKGDDTLRSGERQLAFCGAADICAVILLLASPEHSAAAGLYRTGLGGVAGM